jgi:glycopeptide antibiotics resistance protein
LTISHADKLPASSSERLDPLAGWLTLAVVLIILAGTLFPYRFSLEATASRRVGFFLFWFKPPHKNWPGWLLNLVMFLPFGFALAWWTRVRQWRWLAGPVAIGAAGFLFSYTVEFLQLFVVQRDSSWDDVMLNTAGALVGWLLFRRLGARLLRSAEGKLAGSIASPER